MESEPHSPKYFKLGSFQPCLCFCTDDGTVHVLYSNGKNGWGMFEQDYVMSVASLHEIRS